MDSWNAIAGQDGREYVLLNKNRTLIRLSERVSVDIGAFMHRLEAAGVPLSFADGLKEIYFTYLRANRAQYLDGVVEICSTETNLDKVCSSFVHELGHHIDELNGVSDRKKIIEEKRKYSHLMPDSYARKNVDEYVACGFEVYYFGTRKERGDFRRSNPKLYNAIRYLDRKYSSR